MMVRESSDPYYDLVEDFDLIIASFQSQYGIRLSRDLEGMKWDEFRAFLQGIAPETPLGRIVSIRAEMDEEVLKHFTPEQNRIRSEWLHRTAKAKNGIANILNNLRIDAPQWVTDLTGITSLGFHLPTWTPRTIPYLAQGGFVKANTPRLAMIGDNRHYGEVVAPENKMQEMVDAAVRAVSGSGGVTREELEAIVDQAVSRLVSALANMGFYLDGEEMARFQAMALQAMDIRYNDVTLK